MRRAEAALAIQAASRKTDEAANEAVQEGFRALLDFAEHDFGGVNWRTAALSADVRAGAATRALAIARSLSPDIQPGAVPSRANVRAEKNEFSWHGGRVVFDPSRCGLTSIQDEHGHELVPQEGGVALGELIHTRYEDDQHPGSVFPKAVPFPVETVDRHRVRTRRRLVGRTAVGAILFSVECGEPDLSL